MGADRRDGMDRRFRSGGPTLRQMLEEPQEIVAFNTSARQLRLSRGCLQELAEELEVGVNVPRGTRQEVVIVLIANP